MVRVRVRVMVRVMVRAMVRATVRVRVRVLFLIVVSLGYSSVQRVKRRGQIPSLPTVLPADGLSAEMVLDRGQMPSLPTKCSSAGRAFDPYPTPSLPIQTRRQRGPSAWRV